MVAAASVLVVVLAVALDYLEAQFKGYSFYLSESFLFSATWWLCVPIMYVQFRFLGKKHSARSGLIITSLAIVAHLVIYPALVWFLSLLTLDHSFAYWQTFQYAVSTHLLALVFLYALPLVWTSFRSVPSAGSSPTITIKRKEESHSSFTVRNGSTHLVLEAADIIAFAADPPYVAIQVPGRKYLQQSTLKSVLETLDSRQFIRVHKSTIINISHLKSWRSRSNGDYDLSMSDGSVVRLSRTYAGAFKSLLHLRPQDTL